MDALLQTRKGASCRALLVVLVSALFGCDAVTVREIAGEVAEPQRGAIEVLVTARGMETMYSSASPDGLALEEAASAENSDGVRLGPLSQSLPIRELEATPGAGAAVLQLQLGAPQVTIPTRSGSGVDTVICRWQVRADEALVVGEVMLLDDREAPTLAPLTPTNASLSNPRVNAIGACPMDVASEDAVDTPARARFEEALVLYTEKAIARAADRLLERAPLDAFGVLDGTLSLSHSSSFESRRGQLRLTGQTPTTLDSAGITSEGLSLTRDAAARFVSAPCAPLDPLDDLEDVSPAPLDPVLVNRQGADFAMAITSTYMTRLAQSATRAGLICLGLESIGLERLGGADDTIATSDLFLEDIGIDDSLLATRARLAISPGGLPSLKTRANLSVIEVSWPNLGLSVWVDVFGTPTRVVELVADTVFTMRIDPSRRGFARLTLETLTVSDATLNSDWIATAPQETARLEWARRVMLLALGSEFELPLPLAPGTPANLLGVQIRERDMVLFYSLEADP